MADPQTIQEAANLFKVLGDPTRLSILVLLSKDEENVSAIGKKLGIEQSNVSHQLKLLRKHQLVKSRRDGKSKIYAPDDAHVYEFLTQVLDHVEEKSKEESDDLLH